MADTTGGYPGYSRYYGYGLGGYGGYYGHGWGGYGGYYWGKRDAPEERMQKREAEAEPEADPYYLYSSYYGHHPYTYGYAGLSHYYAPYTYSAVGTYPYAYYANAGGAIHAVGKRSAE